jgi:hypothetical protein
VNHVPKLIIDDKTAGMNFLERMDLLKNMPAKEVKYFEEIPSSDTFPGGVIRIVTTAYHEPETLPEGIFKIRGRLDKNFAILNIIQDNTLIGWTFTESDSREFVINIEKGDYVIAIPYWEQRAVLYLPVNLLSDLDLGYIERPDSIPFDELKKSYNQENWDGRDWMSEQGSVKDTPGPIFKNYDILRLLNSLGFDVLRNINALGIINSYKIATIQINGVVIEKDFPDMIAYLRSLPAKNVEYIETFLPSEGSPGGTINIVTSESAQ